MKVKVILIAFLITTALPCWSDDRGSMPQSVPGVEFTKIQDLNPNAPATNRPVKQKWAVVMGASKFRENRLTNEDMGMDRAAKNFYEYLIDSRYGRFDPKHVKLLVNGDATRQNIMTAFSSQWLGSLAGPDDLVVVFIATNGFPTTDGGTYLCAYDCALDNIYSTCISMQTLMNTLRQNVCSNRILLIIQSAYSGAAELTTGAKALFKNYNIDIDKVMLGKGYIILSSSKPNEMTWGDSFSNNLISALHGESGLITLQKAFEIAQQKTEQETATNNQARKQSPMMKSDWSGKDLVLGTPPAEQVSQLPDTVTNFLSAESCYLQATKLITAGDVDGAIGKYKQAIDIDPQYADALADYGAALAIKGDWQDAAEMYKKAIGLHGDDELFHVNYARILSKLGLNDQSRKELEAAYQLDPKDKIVLMEMARQSLETEPQKAIQFLQEAVSLYPASCDLRCRLSYAFVKTGDIDKGAEQAKTAVSDDPSSVSANLNWGSILMIKGDVKGAIATYKEATKLAPNNADAHLLLSKCLERNGDNQGAKTELSQYLQFCSSSDRRAESARKHLQELPD